LQCTFSGVIVNNNRSLTSLFISFDGDVVGEFEKSNATHIVVSTDKQVSLIYLSSVHLQS